MKIDPTTVPISFQLLSASTVHTCSNKLGAVRGDFAIPHASRTAYYFEMTIERLGISDSTYFCIGAVMSCFSNHHFPGSKPNSVGYSSNGRVYVNGDVVDWNNNRSF